MPGITTVRTLLELLKERASAAPNETAYTFLNPDGGVDSITFGELDSRARGIASQLQAGREPKQAPVLLLMHPGIDYICGFLGCIYAGAIPVPAYPPASARQLPRLLSIIENSGAEIACTTRGEQERIQAALRRARLPISEWVLADAPPEADSTWRDPGLKARDIAFIQYTSGSTGEPKGVMVGHENVLAQLRLVGQRVAVRREDVGVFWLPPYHDFGLVGCILFSLFWGHRTVLMRPTWFLANPYRWLRAISDFRGSITGGSDSAFDLCVQAITPQQRAGLDLSCLRVVLNGGEPVRDCTLRSFSEAFADCGFRTEAWVPAYGLAESTLMVSGGAGSNTAPKSITVSRAALERKTVKLTRSRSGVPMVSCGPPLAEHVVAIVDTATHRRCLAEQIGEIWVKGPSVALGYWNHAEETERGFRATIDGEDGDRYMRTGDLGFLHEGQLYMCGRVKDLIVLNGRNLFPQEIEQASFEAAPQFRSGGAAAFLSGEGPSGRLVVVQELEFGALATSGLADWITLSVVSRTGATPGAVVLVRAGSLPRTSSGKVRRYLSKKRFAEHALDVLAQADGSHVVTCLPARILDEEPVASGRAFELPAA